MIETESEGNHFAVEIDLISKSAYAPCSHSVLRVVCRGSTLTSTKNSIHPQALQREQRTGFGAGVSTTPIIELTKPRERSLVEMQAPPTRGKNTKIMIFFWRFVDNSKFTQSNTYRNNSMGRKRGKLRPFESYKLNSQDYWNVWPFDRICCWFDLIAGFLAARCSRVGSLTMASLKFGSIKLLSSDRLSNCWVLYCRYDNEQ